MHCQFFESQWVLPRKIACGADMEYKCNTAQVRNKSEPLRPHLSLFWEVDEFIFNIYLFSEYKDRINFVHLSKNTF